MRVEEPREGRGAIRRFVATALAAVLVWTGAAWAAPAGSKSAGDEHGAESGEGDGSGDGHHSGSRLTDEVIPLQLEGFPERPRFIIEWGNPYLGTGRIGPGGKLPTGAYWQPTLIVFGTLRAAIQSFEAQDVRFTEAATRLDLFANLALSGTERLVIGFRNFDQSGRFTSYIFDPDPGDPAFEERFGNDDRFQEELNADIQSLFFEGDFGEIFPNLDKEDFGRADVGFSVGRQPLLFQEGILISDSIDGLGITRNTLLPKGTSNYRMTFFFGADNIDRANVPDESASLYALLTSTDFRATTMDADLALVTGDEITGDLAAFGISFVQRIGKTNSSLRFLASRAIDEETPFATDGALVFSELSWTPHHTHDLFYLNTFVAVDEFSSAARDPAVGGPLGRAGINFAAVGLGTFGAPLSNLARDVAGGAIGYQKFYGALARRQLLGELGVRVGTRSDVADSAAGTLRFQSAHGKHFVLVLDGFVSYRDAIQAGIDSDTSLGGRFEMVLKF